MLGAGELSSEQAEAVSDAVAADPDAEPDLLQAAGDQSVSDLKRSCRDRKVAVRIDELRGFVDTSSGRIDDLGAMLREFRTSVSHELQATDRRFDTMADEVRDRITTSETAILTTIRDLGRESDRRLTWMEDRVADVERQVDERPT